MTERSGKGCWRHDWIVRTELGSVNIHIEDYLNNGLIELYGEVGIHYRIPPYYKKDEPPDHSDCPYNHGICWHDGSSLCVHEWLAEGNFLPINHEFWFSRAKEFAIDGFKEEKFDINS